MRGELGPEGVRERSLRSLGDVSRVMAERGMMHRDSVVARHTCDGLTTGGDCRSSTQRPCIWVRH